MGVGPRKQGGAIAAMRETRVALVRVLDVLTLRTGLQSISEPA
jgi:hypothetical protein